MPSPSPQKRSLRHLRATVEKGKRNEPSILGIYAYVHVFCIAIAGGLDMDRLETQVA
jgi:hypothetical protein